MALAAAAAACGGELVTERILAPDPVRCRIQLSQPPATPLPAAGAALTVDVTADRDCAWEASSDASWAEVRPAAGQGTGTLTLTVGPNTNPAPRSAAVVVNDARVTVAQEPRDPCRFALGGSRARVDNGGGSASVTVSAGPGCEWHASSPVGWLRVSPTADMGDGEVRIDADPNAGGERSATLSIADLPFEVTQGPAPPVCTFAISPSTGSFGFPGGTGSIVVTTPPGCSWTAEAQGGWLSLTGGSGGTGPGTVTYRVSVNPETVGRNGTVIAAGHTHAVRQEPFRPESIAVEGPLENLSGSCPAFSFTVAGRRFVTDSNTNIYGGCGEIRPGIRVSVHGDLRPDGVYRASFVDADD